MATYDSKDEYATHRDGSPDSPNPEKTDLTNAHDERLGWFTPQESRKIKHRVDRRLVVPLGIMYCCSLMDRTNLSNAAIAGMTIELDMETGFRYVCISCTE